jgi:hypothetical protein
LDQLELEYLEALLENGQLEAAPAGAKYWLPLKKFKKRHANGFRA